ncbi:DNA alkylation repair protein [Actinoplanes sp. LDG1-06]|uniref:DNA alkylation repair protein n=1 Tax=Paractinoplanes ovalisporus TaxID=2810368 RepID=A0ABS2AF94_9ACTN|nr:DNA alkylation repair protein [Actinoplanes ovalisporus]MBM2618498.1 DNA alkylation repair protein [Actinoplanes ovalisporus]
MPFADELLSARTAENLTHAVRETAPDLPLPTLEAAARGFDGLALRERADLLRDALLTDIPGDYSALARIARSARIEGWMVWPVTSAVAARAVASPVPSDFDDAMALLAELTGLLTAEFAIRTMLRHDLDRALATMLEWTRSDDTDVRRLASEGARPYLPWSVRVPEILSRHGVTVPILDALYRDPSDYVRRSVANHLNDLSRDHPALVVDTVTRWLASPDQNTARTVRHALRTLIKRGDAGALAALGFTAATSLRIEGPTLNTPIVAVGDTIEFHATVHNAGDEPARLAIDYVVHHQRANGTQTAKTFKLTTATVNPGETLEVRRKHSFRIITTRRYHPGPHAIALQVNGVPTDRVPFDLIAPAGPA